MISSPCIKLWCLYWATFRKTKIKICREPYAVLWIKIHTRKENRWWYNTVISTNTLKCGDGYFVATCYLKISSRMPINADLLCKGNLDLSLLNTWSDNLISWDLQNASNLPNHTYAFVGTSHSPCLFKFFHFWHFFIRMFL